MQVVALVLERPGETPPPPYCPHVYYEFVPGVLNKVPGIVLDTPGLVPGSVLNTPGLVMEAAVQVVALVLEMPGETPPPLISPTFTTSLYQEF